MGMQKRWTNMQNIENRFYMSPEVKSDEDDQRLSVSDKSDVWSFGCVIYELCTLKIPPYAIELHDLLPYLKHAHTKSMRRIVFIQNTCLPKFRKEFQFILDQ